MEESPVQASGTSAGEDQVPEVPWGAETANVRIWLLRSRGWSETMLETGRCLYDQNKKRIGGYRSLHALLQQDSRLRADYWAYKEEQQKCSSAAASSAGGGGSDKDSQAKKTKKSKQSKPSATQPRRSKTPAAATKAEKPAAEVEQQAVPPAVQDEEDDPVVDAELEESLEQLQPSQVEGLTLESVGGIADIRMSLMRTFAKLRRFIMDGDKRFKSVGDNFLFESKKIGNATHLLLFVLESREWHPLLLDFMYQEELQPFYGAMLEAVEREKEHRRAAAAAKAGRTRKTSAPAPQLRVEPPPPAPAAKADARQAPVGKAHSCQGAKPITAKPPPPKGPEAKQKVSAPTIKAAGGNKAKEKRGRDDKEEEEEDRQDRDTKKRPAVQKADGVSKQDDESKAKRDDEGKANDGSSTRGLAVRAAKRRRSAPIAAGLTCLASERYYGRAGSSRSSMSGDKSSTHMDLGSTTEVAVKAVGLARSHEEELQRLQDEYGDRIPEWISQLKAGFHLMLHGVGSKRAIMEELGERLAAYGDVIHADGATDIMSCRSRLVELISRSAPGRKALQALEARLSSSSYHCRPDLLVDAAASIVGPATEAAGQRRSNRRGFERACVAKAAGATGGSSTSGSSRQGVYGEAPSGPVAEHLFLVLSGMDSKGLLGSGVVSLFRDLVHFPAIHFVGSVDNVNAPLLWVTEGWGLPRWVWHDVSTFAPYVGELRAIERSQRKGSGKAPPTKEGLRVLLESLTARHLDFLEMLAKHQLNVNRSGMSFDEICQECRALWIAKQESSVRQLFVELLDHMILKQRNANAGRNSMYFIPRPDAQLKEIIAFKVRQAKARAGASKAS